MERRTPQITANLESRINLLHGCGQPLSKENKNFFEPRFGRNFSDVRVHTDSNANQLAESIDARAFTRESEVVFGRGEYRPENSSGKRLLAHELTHVVQQNADKAFRVARQRKQPEEINVFRHGGYQFKLNFSFSPKEGNDVELSIEAMNFLEKKGIDDLDHQVAISNSIRDCTEQAGLKYEIGQTYDYYIAVKFVKGRIDWLRVILTRPKVYTYDYGQKEERKEPSATPLTSLEKFEKTIEDTEKSLKEVDGLLAKLELAAQFVDDNEMSYKIHVIRDKLKHVGGPLSDFVQAKDTVKRGLEFCYVIIQTSKHDPGSKEALLSFIAMGKEAGALLRDLSQYMPAGLSQFCEALGEAVSMFPGFVNNIKRLGELRLPHKRLRLQRIRERILQKHPDITGYIKMIREMR